MFVFGAHYNPLICNLLIKSDWKNEVVSVIILMWSLYECSLLFFVMLPYSDSVDRKVAEPVDGSVSICLVHAHKLA